MELEFGFKNELGEVVTCEDETFLPVIVAEMQRCMANNASRNKVSPYFVMLKAPNSDTWEFYPLDNEFETLIKMTLAEFVKKYV